MFEKIFVEIWPWYVSGPAVGLFVLAFLFFKNRPLGASSTYQATLEAMRGTQADEFGTGPKSALPIDPRDPAPRWQIWFLVGLFLGGALSWAFGGRDCGSFSLPGFDEFFHLGIPGTLALLFFGGALIGFGTRMSGGCTSGHAIMGISNMQAPSLYATVVFFAVGMAFSFALRALFV